MPTPLPTDRELDALKILWQQGRATVRRIYEQLHPAQGDLAYTTVLSLMQTMEKKGLVGREVEGKGKTHIYFARANEEPTLRRLAHTFVDKVFDGAVGQYVVRAIESKQLSVAEIEEIEAMVADAKRQRAGGQSRGKRE